MGEIAVRTIELPLSLERNPVSASGKAAWKTWSRLITGQMKGPAGCNLAVASMARRSRSLQQQTG